jgi:hypothetical protein
MSSVKAFKADNCGFFANNSRLLITYLCKKKRRRRKKIVIKRKGSAISNALRTSNLK